MMIFFKFIGGPNKGKVPKTIKLEIVKDRELQSLDDISQRH